MSALHASVAPKVATVLPKPSRKLTSLSSREPSSSRKPSTAGTRNTSTSLGAPPPGATTARFVAGWPPKSQDTEATRAPVLSAGSMTSAPKSDAPTPERVTQSVAGTSTPSITWPSSRVQLLTTSSPSAATSEVAETTSMASIEV